MLFSEQKHEHCGTIFALLNGPSLSCRQFLFICSYCYLGEEYFPKGRKSRSFGKSRFSKEVGQVTWKLGKTVLSPNVNRMDECSDIRLQTITAEKTEMIEHIKSTTNQRQNRVTCRDSDMSHHDHQALPSEYSVKLPKRKFLLFTTRLIRLMHVASICIVRLAY